MSEDKILEAAEINDEELDEVAGGKSSKGKAEKTKNKCLECMKATHIGSADNSSYIYKAKGSSTSCCKRGHVWVNGIYSHFSEADVKKWFADHK